MNPRTALLSLATALIAMFALAAPAGAAPGALKILNYSPCLPGQDVFTGLNTKLRTTPGVVQVDSNGAPELPSAAALAAYDGVIVSSYCALPGFDGDTPGNALADYQDAGGVVIAMLWTSWRPQTDPGYAILGRWGSTMAPFQIEMSGGAQTNQSAAVPSNNPLFAGITSLVAQEVYPVGLTANAQGLVTFNGGSPAVAVKGRAMAVNAIPADAYTDLNSQWDRLFVNAINVLGRQNVTVTKAGKGKGTVTGSVGGINCGVLCSAIVNSGTAVTLTAKASKGSAFAGWTGSCTGNAAACTTNAEHPGLAATATFASVKLKFGKLKGKKLAVTLPGAGKLKVSGSGLKAVSKSSKKAGKVTLTLKLKSGLKKKIAKNGKAKVKIKFGFTPTGAAKASSSSKSFTIK